MEKRLREAYYDRGKFDKCLSEIKIEREELKSEEKKEPVAKELLALEGWCYYRKGEFKIARKKFKEAGEVNSAKEGLAYLAAYIDKDDETLQKLAQELGSISIQSALIVRARDKDSHLISHKKIEEILERIPHFEATETEIANLYHNAARFYYHKARHKEDLLTALGLFQKSLDLYGSDQNWHHRGAVYYWISKVRESLSEYREALEAARESLYCWTEQLIIDPRTTRHKRRWNKKVKHIRKLVRKRACRALLS